MIFSATDRLRGELEVARAQHATARAQSQQAGLDTEAYVALGKLAEYHRGRADGLRRALDVVAATLRDEVKQEIGGV